MPSGCGWPCRLLSSCRRELKAEWLPDHSKVARRQIAGHANVARGDLWLIGVDEKRGVAGVDQQEENGIFHSGDGRFGDMRFVGGNAAIRDHEQAGKHLYLFEGARRGFCRYLGQMICTGHHLERRPDTNGHMRQAIIFELTPVEAFAMDAAGATAEG